MQSPFRIIVAVSLATSVVVISSSCSAQPPSRPDVVELGITGSLELLASGRTSVELTTAYLDRIEAYDDDLNAIIAVNPEALEQAAASDGRRANGGPIGRLEGVPIVLKDNIDVSGMPTTNGATAFEDYLPEQDAAVVSRLEAEGAVILAKANMFEFAFSSKTSASTVGGVVHNPYDTSRTSTGSSGGSAAAVAASFAAAGLGTDTWGSIRNPAGHQALVGVRPTHGLISLAGVTAEISQLDAVGPMALTVEDAALLLDVLVGSDPADPFSAETDDHVTGSYVEGLSDTALEGVRVGVPTDEYLWQGEVDLDELDPTNQHDQRVALMEAAIAEFEAQGATVVPVTTAEAELSGYEWAGEAYWMDKHWASNAASYPAALAGLSGPDDTLNLEDYFVDGRGIIDADAEEYYFESGFDDAAAAENWSQLLAARGRLIAFFEGHDLDAIILPGDLANAMPLDVADEYYWDGLGEAPSTGAPAISIPVGFTDAGLPASIQLLGVPYSEKLLLAMAYDYEQAAGGNRIAPPGFPELGR